MFEILDLSKALGDRIDRLEEIANHNDHYKQKERHKNPTSTNRLAQLVSLHHLSVLNNKSNIVNKLIVEDNVFIGAS